MIDPTQKDLTAAQIREHALALQVPALRDELRRTRDAWAVEQSALIRTQRELDTLRAWIKEVRDLAASGALVAPAAVLARILDDGLRGDL